MRRTAVALALLLAGLQGFVAAGPAPQAPQVAITSPSEGDTVSGLVLVQGTAADELGIASVQLRVDDGSYQAADKTGDTQVTWSTAVDARDLTNGPHTVTARARNDGGEVATTSLGVVVTGGLDTDLRVAELHGDTGFGGSTALHVTVANDGSRAVPGVEVRFEYRYAGTWRTLGNVTLDLPAHGTAEGARNWSGITKLGRFDVRATADPANAVRETNESNNAAQGSAAFWTDAVAGVDALEPPGLPKQVPVPRVPVTHRVAILGPEATALALGGGPGFDLYAPHAVVVRAGDSVTWVNLAPDGLPHTATRLNVDAQRFDTGPLEPGAMSLPVTFPEPGNYLYYCTLHLGFVPTAQVVVLP